MPLSLHEYLTIMLYCDLLEYLNRGLRMRCVFSPVLLVSPAFIAELVGEVSSKGIGYRRLVANR